MAEKKTTPKKKAPAKRAPKPRPPKPPPFVVPTEDEILGADPRAVALIASSNRPTWQALVPIMKRSDACPEKLMLALLELDDFDGWRGRIYHAFVGLNPDDGMEADWVFRGWFTAGVASHSVGKTPRGLAFRFASAKVDGAVGHLQRLRDLTRDIEMSLQQGEEQSGGDQDPRKDLLGVALLHQAIRACEDNAHDEELVLAQRSEGIFAARDATAWVAQARRVRGGALLCLQRFDEALALLDTLWDTPRPEFDGQCSFRSVPRLDPIADFLRDAARIASWASRRSPQWLDAVKSMGEKFDHPGCAAWFEANRPRVLDESIPASEIPAGGATIEVDDDPDDLARWR